MTNSRHKVTIFSSIPSIAAYLRQVAPELLVEELVDESLTGYGGTAEFQASALQPSTKQSLQQARILVTEPHVLASILQHDASIFGKLEWCQSTYAGVDPLFTTTPLGSIPSFTLTRFAGKFGPPMAEWCLARIIAHERQFQVSHLDQQARQWAGSRGGPSDISSYRYLSDLTLVVLGCGDIGLCIGKACRALGMNVTGYVRTHRNLPDGMTSETDLTKTLQQADYIISVLPSTVDTRDMLSGDALQCASKEHGGRCPVFLNVGRGDVLDEDSLIRALDQNYLAAAILDVFPVEPLPATSPLWTRPDVVISPHVSAITRGSDVPDVFMENYKRHVAKEPLLYVVDWKKGY